MEKTTISNSKLKTFTRCQRAYYYKYVLNLQGKRKKETLERGTLVHACLEDYYRKGFEPKAMIQPLKDYKKKLRKMFDEERALYEHIPGEVAQILRGYHRHWQDQRRFEVLNLGKDIGPAVEAVIEVPLTSNVELGVTLDLAVEDHMGIWVMDTKTARTLPSDEFRLTDTQSRLYEWALEQVLGKEVMGIIWNYVRTKVPAVPELLKSGGLSKRKNIDTDKYTYLKTIKDHDLDPADYEDILSILPDSKIFYHRIRCSKDKVMMKDVLESAALAGERIHQLRERDNPKNYLRGLSFMCERDCEFRPLCVADMKKEDTDFIINTYYEPRKEDKYGNKDQED